MKPHHAFRHYFLGHAAWIDLKQVASILLPGILDNTK
jgi:hypothetical protein